MHAHANTMCRVGHDSRRDSCLRYRVRRDNSVIYDEISETQTLGNTQTRVDRAFHAVTVE